MRRSLWSFLALSVCVLCAFGSPASAQVFGEGGHTPENQEGFPGWIDWDPSSWDTTTPGTTGGTTKGCSGGASYCAKCINGQTYPDGTKGDDECFTAWTYNGWCVCTLYKSCRDQVCSPTRCDGYGSCTYVR
jgi:hypothetical protein